MNSKIIKIISALLSGFIILYGLVQIVTFFHNPYQAETVFETTVRNSVRTQGLVFRDEAVIDQKKSGVISYEVQSGGKVAQQSVIAKRYATEQDMLAEKQSEHLQKEIDMLTAVQQKGTIAAATLDSITTQVNDNYLQLMGDLNQRDLTDIDDYRLRVQELFCKKQLVIGKQTDYNARIKELKAQQAELKSNMQAKAVSIQSPSSGYFSQYIDGLEQEYPVENADELTLSALQAAIAAHGTQKGQSDSAYLGKIIRSFEWKVAVVIDMVDAASLSAGKKISLAFPSYGNTLYPATVDRIDLDPETQKNIVILSCNVIDDVIPKLRVEDLELVLSTVTGIQVPKAAIRYEHDEMGAYERIGQKLYFRKIDKLYETDDFVISKNRDAEDTKHDYVHVYDDVVVKGKDLYDKKPIQ